MDPFGGCAVADVWAPRTEWIINGQPYFDFSVMNLANPGCETIGATKGTFGLFATPALERPEQPTGPTVQGYPGDRIFGTHWRMGGRITKPTSGWPSTRWIRRWAVRFARLLEPHRAGPCTGPCGKAVHAYGVGARRPALNGGPRLTAVRIGQIAEVADKNGT